MTNMTTLDLAAEEPAALTELWGEQLVTGVDAGCCLGSASSLGCLACSCGPSSLSSESSAGSKCV